MIEPDAVGSFVFQRLPMDEPVGGKGYADPGTPEIARLAGVTRGALYHHFADKADLFHAVAIQEAEKVSTHIAQRARRVEGARCALIAGTIAYFEALGAPGRARLLLIECPAVLSAAVADDIDRRMGRDALQQGLEAARSAGQLQDLPIGPLCLVLSAALDRAALAVASGGNAEDFERVARALITALVAGDP